MKYFVYLLAVAWGAFAVWAFADNKINDDAKATAEMLKIMTRIKRDQADLNAFYKRQSDRCLPGVVTIDAQGTVTCVAAPQPAPSKQEEKK